MSKLHAELDADAGEPLCPSVAAAGITPDFTPSLALIAKARAFDDRLTEVIEHWLHLGSQLSPGLFRWLPHLRQRLAPGTAARDLLDGAAVLSGEVTAAGPSQYLHAFLSDPRRSKPHGIYTGSATLQRIFLCDRLLQTPIGPAEAAAIREALDREPALTDIYRAHVGAVAGVLGELGLPPVIDDSAAVVSFTQPIELAASRFDPLAPDEELSIEPGAQYRRLLETGLVDGGEQSRRTRAFGSVSLDPQPGAPSITVEPLPERYERIAGRYCQLSDQLRATLGELPILAELDEVRALMSGAAAASRLELGQRPVIDRADVERFRSWQQGCAEDPDLAADLRTAAPLDDDRVRASLGVRQRTLRLAGPSGELAVTGLVEVAIDAVVRMPPDPDELRALCDEHRVPAAIKAALERH